MSGRTAWRCIFFWVESFTKTSRNESAVAEIMSAWTKVLYFFNEICDILILRQIKTRRTNVDDILMHNCIIVMLAFKNWFEKILDLSFFFIIFNSLFLKTLILLLLTQIKFSFVSSNTDAILTLCITICLNHKFYCTVTFGMLDAAEN